MRAQIVGTILTGWLLGSQQTSAGAVWLQLAPLTAAAAPEIPMLVLIHNDAGVPPDILEKARQLASSVFHDAGAGVIWMDAAAFARSLPVQPEERRAFVGSVMQVRIMSRSMRKAMAVRDDSLGMAIPGARFAWIAFDKLRDSAYRAHIDVGDALGYVIAHEIGHSLLPANAHAATGLMRKELDPALVALNRVRFSVEQGARIRSTLEDLQPGSAPDYAFRFFASLFNRDLDAGATLELIRPLPIGVDEKRRVLAQLPAEGELRPTDDEAAKLDGLQPILNYHQRQDVFDIKVIDLPQAVVVLHDRAVLLLSRPALRLLSPPELQALVAHEAGHDYFWAQYVASRDRDDARARQELELRCDAIAVLTLVDLGLDPAALISGLRKLTLFNERLGTRANYQRYPTMDERERFVHAITGLYGRLRGWH